MTDFVLGLLLLVGWTCILAGLALYVRSRP